MANRDKWARLNWSAYDNYDNLPQEFIQSLESLPDVMKKRMLYGQWVSSDGLVYEEWDEDVNVIDDFTIPDSWTRFRAIDFGFTNPFVCLWGAMDGDDRIYIYREIYRKGVRTALLADEIKDKTGSEKILFTVADHDAQERSELESAGVYTEAAHKAVMLGIQQVKNRIVKAGDGKPRLFVFRSCKNILTEFGSYEWLANPNGGDTKDTPKKENDHAMDALRYMVVAVNEKTGSTIKALLKSAAV